MLAIARNYNWARNMTVGPKTNYSIRCISIFFSHEQKNNETIIANKKERFFILFSVEVVMLYDSKFINKQININTKICRCYTKRVIINYIIIAYKL